MIIHYINAPNHWKAFVRWRWEMRDLNSAWYADPDPLEDVFEHGDV